MKITTKSVFLLLNELTIFVYTKLTNGFVSKLISLFERVVDE